MYLEAQRNLRNVIVRPKKYYEKENGEEVETLWLD
jgi:hypothetical protein